MENYVMMKLEEDMNDRLYVTDQRNTKKKTGSNALSILLISVAVVLLILAALGAVNAAQLNQQLQRNGLGHLSIDEAIEVYSSLAKYTGGSLNDYFSGADSFVLFTVTSRTILAIAGAGAMILGFLNLLIRRRKQA